MENNNESQNSLDFWSMKNMSTCEYDSVMGSSAWQELDKIDDDKWLDTTDSRNDDSNNDDSDDD